jgi:hypothetical protein
MELIKKTTILFPPDLHTHLVEVARQKGVSLGELVRSACEAQYGVASKEERLRAVERLRRLSLPVASVKSMKRQSLPSPGDLLP